MGLGALIVGAAVVAVGTAVAVGLSNSGESRHKSGPRRTYEKQKRWDEKQERLHQQLSELEDQRSQYSSDSNRFDAVMRRKASLEAKIAAAEERLITAKQNQREIEESMNESLKADAVAAVQTMWTKEANNAVDQIRENCPRLDELTDEMAEEHNKAVEEQTLAGLAILEQYRNEQIQEKKAKIKDHAEAEATRNQLCAIINELEKLQMSAR